MWIQNQSHFGLIKPFPRIQLPELAVIIGPNGAGKSQLLRGIQNGQIKTPFTPTGRNHYPGIETNVTVLLTNNDPPPEGLIAMRASELGSILSSSTLAADFSGMVNTAIRQQAVERDHFRRLLLAHSGKTFEELGIDWRSLAVFAGGSRADSPLENISNIDEIIDEARLAGKRILESMNYPSILSNQSNFADFLSISRDAFSSMIGWPSTPLFTPNLIDSFREYRDRRWRNQVQRQTDLDECTDLAMTPEIFLDFYGPPPWDEVSNGLRSFGLPYRIAPIPSNPSVPVSFNLIRQGSEQTISYRDLSTGEEILFRMMLASFQASDDRTHVRPPKLALLDELDGSLHPENVSRWLNAIRFDYVDKLGICCILTTHSPTTVALVEDGSIFEMTADDAYPKPISKKSALDRLTYGLPMLSIDYSARRQVFTESTIDVDHYAMLHDIMRPILDMPRTLSFVGTSTKGSCVFVYDMVKHMQVNGNRSVFGIVDWDLENKPTGRVKVLADGTHYSKDNVLLDPLLIGALLLKDDDLKLDPVIRYSDLRGADSAVLQLVADAVVNRIKFPPTDNLEISKSHYHGGLVLSVRSCYHLRNGHHVEKLIKEAFPMLEGRYRSEGQLASEVISRVIADFPELCPKPIADILSSLSSDTA